MKASVRHVGVGALLVLPILFLALYPSHAQEPGRRKLLERVAPAYPALARSMALQGVVKVEAVVAPDGSVRSVDVKGGHPVLTQSAVNAVRRWCWEPSAHETREPVELKFSPSD